MSYPENIDLRLLISADFVRLMYYEKLILETSTKRLFTNLTQSPWYQFAIVKGIPTRMKRGNWPIFSTEFERFVYIVSDYRNKIISGHGNSYFDRYLTDILK